MTASLTAVFSQYSLPEGFQALSALAATGVPPPAVAAGEPGSTVRMKVLAGSSPVLCPRSCRGSRRAWYESNHR